MPRYFAGRDKKQISNPLAQLAAIRLVGRHCCCSLDERTHLHSGVFFIFVFFKKKLQKYIFGFRFYNYILLPPGRGRQGAYRPAGGGGGRDLYINKNNFFCAEVFGGSLPPHQLAAGGLPPARGAAGSLLKYKTPLFPSAPSFSAHEIQRGEREGE